MNEEIRLGIPKIIQGGMGVGISDWHLAQTVSKLGQQGTVSGVGLDRVMAVTLQRGDIGGHLRRALSHFPFPHISGMVLKEFFVEGGVQKGIPLKRAPFFTIKPSDLLIALTVCANYAYVWLAKEGHKNPVSINFLEKVSMPHLYAIFGVMLAGGDFITMGAGIPLQIPGVINNFVEGKEAKYCIPIIGKNITSYEMSFNPRNLFGQDLDNLLPLKKPGFIPIIGSNLLASILIKKLPAGSIYGFAIEKETAGGHNSPPRNKVSYGEKDRVNFAEIAKFGLPFWIGGSYASPEQLQLALSVGASGIQVGSIFALCDDSGMNPELRKKLRCLGWNGELKIRTDFRVSSSGYPFKVVELAGTISEQSVYEARPRVCSHGLLVSLYEKPDGTVGYRCAGESLNAFVRKGGDIADTVGTGCLCCGLFSTAELEEDEPPIVTLGDDLSFLKHLMVDAHGSYRASDVVKYLLG